MGENMEKGDVGQKLGNGQRPAKTGKRRLTWRGTLPRVTAKTPENG
jgi:hypothetical protein